jgi:hypothetical protein
MHLRLGAPDRRRIPRGTPEAPRRQELVARLRGLYEEMPGLTLTPDEAAGQLAAPGHACRMVLADLARQGYLRCDNRERYVHAG